MHKENFIHQMEAILEDVKRRIDSIDEQINSAGNAVHQDLKNLVTTDLVHLDDVQRRDFETRHKPYLLQLRTKPLKNAKEKLLNIYSEINTTLDGVKRQRFHKGGYSEKPSMKEHTC